MEIKSLLLILTVLTVCVSAADYCDVQCYNSTKHTICAYPSDAPGRACGTDFQDIRLTPAEIERILDEHNRYRNYVALGNEGRGTRGPQPGASNMRQLHWDSEVAAIAERWARQCSYGHDDCRSLLDGTYVGQNVAMVTGAYMTDFTGLVKLWYDEVALFDKSEVDQYRFDETTGHYTQMVWADTNRLGCARVFYHQVFPVTYLVCNYGAGGNVQGRPMYKQGAPCSACDENTGCSFRYPGLCEGTSHGLRPGLSAMLVCVVACLSAYSIL